MKLILGLTASSLMAAPYALADESSEDAHPQMTSIQAARKSVSSFTTAAGTATAADYEIENGHYDQAIALCREGLEKFENDADLHLVYAKCLEKKLKTQEEQDPYLYNACVKEWLNVLRNESGDEQGVSFHGIGVPLMNTLFRDDDRGGLAHKHLVSLTGRAPMAWETDNRYLKKVLRPSTKIVKGSMVDEDKNSK